MLGPKLTIQQELFFKTLVLIIWTYGSSILVQKALVKLPNGTLTIHM